jgi:hypothetical protein
MNARPGLNIQIANRAGLLSRLKRVEQYDGEFIDIEERLIFSRQHFAA